MSDSAPDVNNLKVDLATVFAKLYGLLREREIELAPKVYREGARIALKDRQNFEKLTPEEQKALKETTPENRKAHAEARKARKEFMRAVWKAMEGVANGDLTCEFVRRNKDGKLTPAKVGRSEEYKRDRLRIDMEHGHAASIIPVGYGDEARDLVIDREPKHWKVFKAWESVVQELIKSLTKPIDDDYGLFGDLDGPMDGRLRDLCGAIRCGALDDTTEFTAAIARLNTNGVGRGILKTLWSEYPDVARDAGLSQVPDDSVAIKLNANDRQVEAAEKPSRASEEHAKVGTTSAAAVPLVTHEAIDWINKQLSNTPAWKIKKCKAWMKKQGLRQHTAAEWRESYGQCDGLKRQGNPRFVHQGELAQALKRELDRADEAFTSVDTRLMHVLP